MVKVVKVKMVIFIFGFGHFTHYIININIYYIVADFDTLKTILTKMTMTKMTAKLFFIFLARRFVNRNANVVPLPLQ